MIWKPWYIHETHGVDAALSHFDEHFDEWTNRSDSKYSSRLAPFVFELMCLLGKPEQAFARTQAYLESLSDESSLPGSGFVPHEFFMERQTEQELLASAETRTDRNFAYFVIGCLRLGEGKRQDAMKSFDNIAQKRKPLWCGVYKDEFELHAAVFLHRLQTDPEWPSWIQDSE